MQKRGSFIFRYFVFLLLITFTSCTVTNRRYLPGYYVNWNSKKIKNIDNKISTITSRAKLNTSDIHIPLAKIRTEGSPPTSFDKQNPVSTPRRKLNDSHPKTYSTKHIPVQAIPKPVHNNSKLDASIKNIDKYVVSLNENNNSSGKQTDKGGKVIDGLAIVCILLGVLSILALPVGIPLVVVAPTSLRIILLNFIKFIIAGLAIIFGANAIKQINQDPQKYKGKFLADIGIVIGIVVDVILLIVLSGQIFY